jgi:hypothetical protein
MKINIAYSKEKFDMALRGTPLSPRLSAPVGFRLSFSRLAVVKNAGSVD